MSLYLKSRIIFLWSKLVNGKENKLSSIMFRDFVLQYTNNHFKIDNLNNC